MRFFLIPLFLIGVHWFYLVEPFFQGTLFDDLPPGRHVDAVPIQEPLSVIKKKTIGDYTLHFHHRFEFSALVLSKSDYFSDRLAQFSPVDLALGWGVMSNPEHLRYIRITQNNRFYFFKYKSQPPISHSDIIEYSANMHFVPANDEIKKALMDARKGDIVQISGYLVDLYADDGWHWKSSRTRNDTGKGACELVYVEDINFR